MSLQRYLRDHTTGFYSVFSMQVPAFAIRSTDRVNKCTNMDVIFKKYIYYTHSCSSEVCAWIMGSRSRLRSILDSPDTLHKTCLWSYTIPSASQCAAAVSPVTFSSQRYRSGVTKRLSVVKEGKAELFIHPSVLMQMHQDCSKVGSPFQLWQHCSSESKTQATVLLQKSTLKCYRNIIKTSPSLKNLFL